MVSDYLAGKIETYAPEFRFRHKDGSYRWILARGKALWDVTGKPYRMAGSHTDITERKQAEEDLASMLEFSPEAIGVVNTQTGLFENVNAAAERLYGLPRHELEKVGPAHMSPKTQPDGRPSLDKAMEKIGGALQGQPQVFEWMHRNAQGQNILCEVRLVGLAAPRQHLVRFSVTDISARKQSEEALRASEAKLTEALQFAKLAYWEYDFVKDEFTFNDQFYAIFHTTVEREGGYHMPAARYAERFCYPDDVPLVGGEIQKAIETSDPNYSARLGHRIRYADGGIGYITVYFRIEKDAQGRTVKSYGVNQDITDRRQVEEALRMAQEQYALAMQGSNDGLWDWDIRTNQVFFSPRWKEMVGYAVDELNNGFADFEALLHPDDHDRVLAAVNDYLTGQSETYDIEFRLHHKDGSYRWIRARGKALRDASGAPYRMAGSHTDITDSKLAQQDLAKRAREQEILNLVTQKIQNTMRIEDALQIAARELGHALGRKPVRITLDSAALELSMLKATKSATEGSNSRDPLGAL